MEHYQLMILSSVHILEIHSCNMQTIIYIEDHTWTPLTQLFDVTSFECSQYLNGVDTASFRISATHKANNIWLLRPFHRCYITTLKEGGTERIYIDGVIDSLDTSLNHTTVYVKSYEYLFEKMLITTAQSFSNQSVHNIVSDLRTAIIQRYDRWIDLACSINDEIGLEVNEGATFGSVLQELIKLWYQYRVIKKTLLIASSIGIDQSSGTNCVLLKRDINDPQDRNINEASIRYDANQLTNAPYAKGTWFQISEESIDTYWRFEQTITTDGSSWQALQDILTKQEHPQQIITIDPRISNFFFASIGDCIALVLDAWNELMRYQWSVYVIQKKIDTRWVIKVTISTTTNKALSFLETIRENQKRLQKLENE
jgi:hypothetical protein